MARLENCIHIYQNVNAEICPHCGRDTHETNWEKNNLYARQWKIDNPNAAYGGWWSI